ncbi:hypothetical protein [Cloacibacillus sp. An23]|uniref:hypothetical protein n=1 Tax=Cloacibacillus sp. An23 TaxID=1965591 RepID=UPI000B38ACF9|nr:hypothetical protein [Cloacibacillus sp. An23]OUO94820.1 hypothetical protein B5F39_02830 [Cloacibacillus sp. An23]
MSNNQQAERPAAPVIYTYDKTTGEYKPEAKATCQWSPRENKWLIPAAATTTEPPTAGEKQAACFDAASKAWTLMPDHRGEKWYDKATRELHEIKDIGVEPDETVWTQTEPKDGESVWDEETGGWVIPPEVQERRNLAEAQRQANDIITAAMQRSAVQTMSFSAAEFKTFAKARLFDEWQAGETYEAGYRLVHEGVVYEVIQQVTAIETQPPSAEGMLAIYRPLSVDSETGDEPDGTLENPYTYLDGMDVYNGKYYSYNGKIYLAKADMLPCTWAPGTAGLWQWEEVTEA